MIKTALQLLFDPKFWMTVLGLIFIVPVGCHRVEDAPENHNENEYLFHINDMPSLFALDTIHGFDASLSMNLVTGTEQECPNIESSQLDLWLRDINTDGEIGDAHIRCSDQQNCSISAMIYQATYSNGWDCHYSLRVEGLALDRAGSVFPTLIYQEEEIYRYFSTSSNMLSQIIWEIKAATDLFVSFNGLDAISAMKGTTGCLEAALVDKDGYLLRGGEIELDYDGIEIPESTIQAMMSISFPNPSFYYLIVTTKFAGSGVLTVRASTLSKKFETSVNIHIYDTDEIAELQFFELVNRLTEEQARIPQGSISGHFSWYPIEDQQLQIDIHSAFPAGSATIIAAPVSDNGDPIITEHSNRVRYDISYGGIVEYLQWTPTYSGYNGIRGSLTMIDVENRNNIPLSPDAWNVRGVKVGEETIEASWQDLPATLKLSMIEVDTE